MRKSLVTCHSGEVYAITNIKIDLTERFQQLIEDAKSLHPMEGDMEVIIRIATDSLYRENESRKWFEIKKL